MEDEVCCSVFINCIKIVGVMGSCEFNDGLYFWNFISIFLIIKCCVIFCWKMKFKDDISVCVDEVVSFLRK